jgi:UDP-3-O-[3-hydroxymyristoyl] glucosamine N-acyltransferase
MGKKTILAGNVTISNNSFLGINSSVRENVVIGKNYIIGSGVFIDKDTIDFAIFSHKVSVQRCGNSNRFIMFDKSANRE